IYYLKENLRDLPHWYGGILLNNFYSLWPFGGFYSIAGYLRAIIQPYHFKLPRGIRNVPIDNSCLGVKGFFFSNGCSVQFQAGMCCVGIANHANHIPLRIIPKWPCVNGESIIIVLRITISIGKVYFFPSGLSEMPSCMNGTNNIV